MSLIQLAKRIASGEDFGSALSDILRKKGINHADFAKKAGIPYTTLYKIIKGKNPSYGTLVKIFRALDETKSFVALIASRYILEEFEFGEEIRVYPVTTLEDALVFAVRAEKEGAKVIICAPIISGIIERMVDIPVITIRPKDSVIKAVEQAVKRMKKQK